MKKRQRKDPAKLTVAELMKTHGVPLPVYLWLERLTGGDKYALQHVEDDPATYHIARLVYDVLGVDEAGNALEAEMIRGANAFGAGGTCEAARRLRCSPEHVGFLLRRHARLGTATRPMPHRPRRLRASRVVSLAEWKGDGS